LEKLLSIPHEGIGAEEFEERKSAVFTRTRDAVKIDRMKFATVLDRDEDGIWIAECPSIPGCVSQGKTLEEALTNIKEAIALCLEVRAERGMPLTIETRQVEVSV
jgi:predicted RNase H-like HicB family nuclease